MPQFINFETKLYSGLVCKVIEKLQILATLFGFFELNANRAPILVVSWTENIDTLF